MSNQPDTDKSKQRRRIFCVITQGEMGGAQRFIAQLAAHLDPGRFSLHVVWGSDSGNALAQRLPGHVTYGVARNLVRPVRPLRDLRAITELRAMMRTGQPDVVLLVSSKAGFVGARAANGLRAEMPDLKVIYRIGGWSFNDPVSRWKKSLYLRMERLSARWKDVIVLNNTHDLDQAHMLGIRPKGKIMRIYNGIDPYEPFEGREKALAVLTCRIPTNYRFADYDFLVGTIANFYPAKDLLCLVRTAARVSENVRFVVIGDGPQRVELERYIREYELGHRFFLLGHMSDAKRYLPALDVFVLPSVKEGFPWALLEAMAAKVPVVATRVGAVPEMLTDHESGMVVEPGQADRLATAIVELLENDHLRREVPIKAHQQVLAKFTLREMIASYEKLFS
jgi:glycosyltransferase involved in cell wall biosynthesis